MNLEAHGAGRRAAPAILLGLMLAAVTASPVLARHHHARHHAHMVRHLFNEPYRHLAAQPEFEAPLYIYHSPYPCSSRDDCDRKDYDESGTRGRLGLGASPYHPEGPGNPR
jgi:hypothetical protein